MSISARRLIIHVILPLFAGLVIYLFFRRNTWLHHNLFPKDLYTFTIHPGWLSNVFVFNVPDFCWSYSLASSLFIWKRMNGERPVKYFPAFVFLLLVAAESVQYFFPLQFTFDWPDIVAAVLAFFLSYLLNRQDERS